MSTTKDKDEETRRLLKSGAVLSPVGLYGAPIRTLSDEYHDEPEPEDSDREPEPEPPSRVRRLLDHLPGRKD